MVSQSNAEAVTDTSSYMLHNQNCFAYLKNLNHIPSFLLELIKRVGGSAPCSHDSPLEKICGNTEASYDEETPYADYYTEFMRLLEDYIEALPKNTLNKKKKELVPDIVQTEISMPLLQESRNVDAMIAPMTTNEKLELDHFIISIFKNYNNILNQTYDMIQSTVLAQNPSSKNIQGAISEISRDSRTSVNTFAKSPAQAGSILGRFTAMISGNFKPQQDTSIPTVRKYAYNSSELHLPIEYRFGTQGQRHKGEARVSPLFEWFLEAELRSTSTTTPPGITHIYFNNLGRDRHDFEGRQEAALTQALDKLEELHPNIAVITLPADKGFMSKDAFESTDQKHQATEVISQFLEVAIEKEDSTVPFKGDFHISDHVRKLLFTEGQNLEPNQSKTLEKLIMNSFDTLCISASGNISDAERQAIWFHFIKFELTDYIITTLKPNGINFSCKDAIDRGGVSSAYYNLLKSFNTANPMNRNEFEAGLHAAPTMVKGRGMNHHLNLIWNTVDAYVTNEHQFLKNNETRAWLIQWRDMNCPHARVEGLLEKRVKELTQELTQELNLLNGTSAKIEKGLEVLNAIQGQSTEGVSGKRLLLETAVLTAAIALDKGSKEDNTRYSSLITELTINYPKLTIVCGLMKAFLGIILLLPSLGTSKGIIQAGWSTMKAGMSSRKRDDMRTGMSSVVENQTQIKNEIQSIRDKSNAVNLQPTIDEGAEKTVSP